MLPSRINCVYNAVRPISGAQYRRDMSFDTLGLEPRLLQSVAAMGFTEPTAIQREAIDRKSVV